MDNDPIEIILNARSTQGRVIQVAFHPAFRDLTEDDLIAGLNSGKYQFNSTNERIVDRASVVIAVVDRLEEDASGTEFSNFASEHEGCWPIDEVPDTELEMHIGGLRGLIDGEQDELADQLSPILGMLLAEQAKRLRQRGH